MTPAAEAADGVILMAYGAPAAPEDVEAFFTHIRGGRRPPEERIEDLKRRYREIGGGGSLLAVTAEQARALQGSLDAGGGPSVRVFFGMRHAPPFIHERMADVGAAGIRRLVGLPLAPHYATLSVGAYHRALREAAASLDPAPALLLVDSWHDHPGFIRALAEVLIEALGRARREGDGPPRVIFTAHSLPERIVAAGEPYRDQLLATARLAAEAAGVADWDLAFQSASPTGEPWLGPDLLDVIRSRAAEGRRWILVAPIGFVADHLEILHDVDIVARRTAEEAGARLRRTASLNARPSFVAALAAIVRERLAAADADPRAGA